MARQCFCKIVPVKSDMVQITNTEYVLQSLLSACLPALPQPSENMATARDMFEGLDKSVSATFGNYTYHRGVGGGRFWANGRLKSIMARLEDLLETLTEIETTQPAMRREYFSHLLLSVSRPEKTRCWPCPQWPPCAFSAPWP